MAEENRISKYAKALGEKKWLLLLLALAILLLILGGERKGAGTDTAESAADIAARTEAYRTSLEDELAALCTEVRGAGRVSVMITLDGTESLVYAADARGEGKIDYVVSGGEGLLLCRRYPAVVGVAIICEGDSSVREELARLSSAVLGIGLNRIYVGGG